jgi:CRP/FNR family cyclic AMP-dependent transcriptional regulator
MVRLMSDAIMGELLRRVPIFADLSPAELAEVVNVARSMPKRKGARIFEEGSPPDCCLVLTAGRAKVVLSGARGSEVTVGVLEPFSVVGEIGLLDGSSRSASLVALDDCQFIRIPAAAFNALRRNTAFAQKLFAHLASMIRRANDQLRAIYTFKAEDRVLWSLAKLARQHGETQGGDLVLRPKPAHQELADMTGCSRETVTRALQTLKRAKYVSWDTGSVRLDLAALRRHPGAETGDVTEITRLV